MRYSNLKLEIEKCKPKTILEIGTWDGVHSCEMISSAQKFNKDIVYFGFDVFEKISEEVRRKELHVKDIQRESTIKARLEKSGAVIHLHVGYTNETLPSFTPDTPIDFAYIDGGHSLETIQNDWEHVEKLIHDDTVVIFDDYYNKDETKGCYSLIQSLKKNERYSVEILDPEDRFPNGLNIRFVKLCRK